MAYAAVTSLKGTLHLHFLQSQPRFPLQHKPEILNSLQENLGFLQEILEKSEIAYAYDNSAMKDFEAEMRDVAFKAEERIEMELSNIYLQSSSIDRLDGILKQAVKQTDYLKKKFIKIQSIHPVTSLKEILHLHFFQSQPRLPLIYKGKVVSLNRNLGFLQESLEKLKFEIAYDDAGAMKDLEAQIRDVAFKTEKRIVMELTTISPANSWTKRVACHLRLHGIFNEAVKQTDYLTKKLIKIQSERQLAEGPSQGTSPIVHRNLESISWLDSKLCTKDLFTRIPNLKKLGIDGRYDKNNLDWFYNFVHLRQLEELSIIQWCNLGRIPCSGISWATSFLPNLKRLKFIDTNLAWSDMRLIGMLPNLEVLKLKRAIAREHTMWEPSEEGFRQLKRLVIEDRFLQHWNAVGDHFPVLECLELRACYQLKEIPSGFVDITTLVLIQLNWCRDTVLASAKLIQEEQYNNYGNALLVRSENIHMKKLVMERA
nr:putative late blight resistance protein homolog R1B-17 isoform X3 [Ipomoea trifida]